MIPLCSLGLHGRARCVAAGVICMALVVISASIRPAEAVVRPSGADAGTVAGLARKGLEQMRVEGALDKCITREFLRGGKLEVHYPQFDQPKVDEELRQWATALASRFESDAREVQDELAWELAANYEISKPSAGIVSVAYEIYSYTGGVHGMYDIFCRNFELATGRELELDDLFDDPAQALELMSAYARKDLERQLEDGVVEDMLMAGTRPEPECFSALRLTPEGVTVEFSPYDVAPWAAGPQKVDIPLSELAAAGPSRLVWPQQ